VVAQPRARSHGGEKGSHGSGNGPRAYLGMASSVARLGWKRERQSRAVRMGNRMAVLCGQ
jgi:hypothetical protein